MDAGTFSLGPACIFVHSRHRVLTDRHAVARYMTWDKALFPKPEEMQNSIASRGRKVVTIVDPHIKRDPAYPIFKAAEDKGYYVKNKDNKDYDGCALLCFYQTCVGWAAPSSVGMASPSKWRGYRACDMSLVHIRSELISSCAVPDASKMMAADAWSYKNKFL